MPIGLTAAAITKELETELSRLGLPDEQLTKIAQAVTTAMDKNNQEIDRELGRRFANIERQIGRR